MRGRVALVARQQPLLSVTGLSISFGGLAALSDLDLAVQEGTIHSLIGPNGSGKTTVFNLITGIYKPSRGDIVFEGKRLVGLRPDQIARAGVARTFQNSRLFAGLTVFENILIGQHSKMRQSVLEDLFGGRRAVREGQKAKSVVSQVIALLGLEHVADEEPRILPYGLQRRVEIARALATQCHLLLLDEPTGGMNPTEVNETIEVIRRVRDTGVTVLLVEHNMNVVMGISDCITVLNQGQRIAEGTPVTVSQDRAVQEAYLGGSLERAGLRERVGLMADHQARGQWGVMR